MAIRVIYNKKWKNTTLITGNIYSFKYQAWEHDPRPTICFMGWYQGTHPNTGHQWRFIQGINFFYIQRSHRKQFIKLWTDQLKDVDINKRRTKIKFTWQLVKRRFPYLEGAVRRYFYKPIYYITELNQIPFEQWEKSVVSSWAKDFSKKAKVSVFNKLRGLV